MDVIINIITACCFSVDIFSVDNLHITVKLIVLLVLNCILYG